MSGFAQQLQDFAIDTNRSLSKACRTIKISLFSGLVINTRVDTGRMRGGWQCSQGSPKLNDPNRFDVPKASNSAGQAAINEITANVGDFSQDFCANAVEYAALWNERDAIISASMARIDRVLTEAVNSAAR